MTEKIVRQDPVPLGQRRCLPLPHLAAQAEAVHEYHVVAPTEALVPGSLRILADHAQADTAAFVWVCANAGMTSSMNSFRDAF